MRKICFLLLTNLLAACSYIDVDEQNMVEVNVQFTQFTTSVEPMTRAAVSEVATHLDLWLSDGTDISDYHQTTENPYFGQFTLTLDKTKTYTMYVVAHKCTDAATLTDGIISFPDDKVKDTFYYTTTFTPSSTTSLQCEMQRIVAQLRLETTDQVPASVKKMRITVGSVCDRWNTLTGAGAHQVDRVSTISISSTNQDGTATFNVYGICTDAATNHSVSAEALDANDQVLYSHEFPSVPLQNNHRTRIIGQFFTTNTQQSTSFTATADWAEDAAIINF